MGEDKRRLYIGSLSFKTDEESLRERCEKYGTLMEGMKHICRCEILLN